MKKKILLLSALVTVFFAGNAQVNSSNTGFIDDFSGDQSTLTYTSVTPGVYDITRDNDGTLDVTLTSQVADGYEDMQITFNNNGDTLLDLSGNSEYFVSVENVDCPEILIVGMYCLDVDGNEIFYDVYDGGWQTKIVTLVGPGEKDTITEGDPGLGAVPGFTLSGNFEGGGNIYVDPPDACDLSKIWTIRFRIANADNALSNANVKFHSIEIGEKGDAGISDVSFNKKQINIYPNPVTDGTVNFDQEVENIHVFNYYGSLVKSVERADQLNVSNLPSGLYTVRTAQGYAKISVIK